MLRCQARLNLHTRIHLEQTRSDALWVGSPLRFLAASCDQSRGDGLIMEMPINSALALVGGHTV